MRSRPLRETSGDFHFFQRSKSHFNKLIHFSLDRWPRLGRRHLSSQWYFSLLNHGLWPTHALKLQRAKGFLQRGGRERKTKGQLVGNATRMRMRKWRCNFGQKGRDKRKEACKVLEERKMREKITWSNKRTIKSLFYSFCWRENPSWRSTFAKSVLSVSMREGETVHARTNSTYLFWDGSQ